MKRRVVTTLFRELRYYCKEAFQCIWYNKIMAATSIITVMGCLLLFGFFLVVGINVSYITRQIEGQCEIQAYFPVSIEDDQMLAAQTAIQALPNVKSVQLETREQAFENYRNSLGESAAVMEGLDPGNFLPPSCRIVPKDLTHLDELVEQVKSVYGIEEVINHRETVNNVISVTSAIRKGCIICTLLLAVIAIFIISNTIKLDVYARHKEIHIMKYVGATDWFIRWPFIIEGIIVGLIGAIISIAILITVTLLSANALEVFAGIFELKPSSQTLPLISGILAAFGAFIGAVGSIFAVRRHLHV